MNLITIYYYKSWLICSENCEFTINYFFTNSITLTHEMLSYYLFITTNCGNIVSYVL